MEAKMIERLKLDLKEAVAKKDYAKIAQLKEILNITDEQARYFNQGLTGYPSVDETWLQFYKDNAVDIATSIPVNKTVWDVIEEKILEFYDYPALEYFGREFSRPEFRELCYTWARTFRAMGVEPDEVVPVYGPFNPDIAAMVFGLNMIGATPYFLKLAISPEALAEETKESKIAVVYDGMWKNVSGEFSKDKFKKVIVSTITADMPSPKKEIVSFLSAMQAKKDHSQIPDEKKYVWADKAREIADYYTGEVKVPFVPERSAFITSSSGTTVGGVVKGKIATNESTLSQLCMGEASEVLYYPGSRILNHFPPTASTSLNILFLLPLFRGSTVYFDPRVSEKDFYTQIMTYKPTLAVNTGSMWEAFFNRVEQEMARGKKFDFSYVDGWVVGGEGTDVKKFLRWKDIMTKCGSPNGLASAYGTSEVFSATCTEKYDARCDFSKSIMSVGVPYAGITLGTFDENGKELPFNQRGNLWIKSKSHMKGYYGKPELTATVLEDEWIKTGDLAEIGENGQVYIWGRISDKVVVNNQDIYLFDVANYIKSLDFIDDAIVLKMPLKNDDKSLVAHIVINKKYSDKKDCIEKINQALKTYLPDGLEVKSYFEYDTMLPYSPTTLKKDKNRMSQERTGFVQVIDGSMKDISYVENENGELEQVVNDRITKKLKWR